MKLSDLHYRKGTKIEFALRRAIEDHGKDAPCDITSGYLSTRKNSNAYKTAQRNGVGNQWDVYAGGRAGRYLTEGYRLIVVKSAQ